MPTLSRVVILVASASIGACAPGRSPVIEAAPFIPPAPAMQVDAIPAPTRLRAMPIPTEGTTLRVTEPGGRSWTQSAPLVVRSATPGEWKITASHPERGSVAVTVPVRDGASTDVTLPRLRLPTRLTVDAGYSAPRVVIRGPGAFEHRIEAAAGRWTSGNLADGEYTIEATQGDGARRVWYALLWPETHVSLELAAPAEGLLIAGRRYLLPTDCPIRAPDHPQGLPLSSSKGVGPRLDAAGKPVRTYEALQSQVTHVILHSDLTSDAQRTAKILAERELGTHFVVNWDGTVYQLADVVLQTQNAGADSPGSIGVDLNGINRNLRRPENRDTPPYPADHPDIAAMSAPRFARPTNAGRINNVRLEAYGYNDAQYRSLIALLRVLLRALPALKPETPRGEDGGVIFQTLDPPVAPPGLIVAHWHVSDQRWDPGPAFEWERVLSGLRAPGPSGEER